MQPAISARGLRVTFPGRPAPVEALRGLDLEVPKGSLFVLLGPNGAGKTTLMRCVTGLVAPGGGGLSVLGAPPERSALRRVGVLIENPGAYGRLDVREYLSFFASFYGTPDPRARIDGLCAQFGLEPGGRPVAKLSQGNRQKLQLIRSLLHDPELLLWDEPTDHLDPEAQREVLGYLKSYLALAGATALVATHRLEQMEGVASHFGFIRKGLVVKAGTRAEVLDLPRAAAARVCFAEPPPQGGLEALAGELGVKAEAVSAREARLEGPALQDKLPALIRAMVGRGFAVESVEPLRDGLPEVYASLMEGP